MLYTTSTTPGDHFTTRSTVAFDSHISSSLTLALVILHLPPKSLDPKNPSVPINRCGLYEVKAIVLERLNKAP